MASKVEVTIHLEIEQQYSKNELNQWIGFVTGQRGDISLDNPLVDLELTDVTTFVEVKK